MNNETTVWDALFAALANQYRFDTHGGGMIGKVGAVIDALGVDPDLPMSDCKRRLQGRN